MKKAIIFVCLFLFLAAVAFCQDSGLVLKIFKIKHGNLQSLYEVASNAKSPDGKVSFDTKTNSIIAIDYPESLHRIATIISSLDVQEKQIEIKVLFLESGSAVFTEAGITSSRVVIPSGEFSAILDLLKKNEETSIRSQMMVRTMSNQPAQIQVLSNQVIGEEVVIMADGTQFIQPERASIGKSLEVLPFVNIDNTITVILRPSVSTLQRELTPYERTIYTKVHINDGDTIALGQVDSVDQETTQKQALFGVPLSEKSASGAKKMVMFLTARITD